MAHDFFVAHDQEELNCILNFEPACVSVASSHYFVRLNAFLWCQKWDTSPLIHLEAAIAMSKVVVLINGCM